MSETEYALTKGGRAAWARLEGRCAHEGCDESTETGWIHPGTGRCQEHHLAYVDDVLTEASHRMLRAGAYEEAFEAEFEHACAVIKWLRDKKRVNVAYKFMLDAVDAERRRAVEEIAAREQLRLDVLFEDKG